MLSHVLIGLGSMLFAFGVVAFFYSADRLALHDFGPREQREKAGHDAANFALGGILSILAGAAMAALSFHAGGH